MRLPSNLSQDHPRMCAFSYACHFRSRDKDDGHIIRSAVPVNPVLNANITALCLIERELYYRSKFYIAGIEICDVYGSCDLDLDLDSMTFTYELDP